MVEDIIYNLCNNIDILETNKKIIEYKGTSSKHSKFPSSSIIY